MSILYFKIKLKQKQITLLMIHNEKDWRYLAVKRLSVVLREITSNNNGNFCFLNRLHSFRRESKITIFVESLYHLKKILH